MGATPGPWTAEHRNVSEDGPPTFCGYIMAGPNADIHEREIAVLYGDVDREANARLIAAAPDMLEALKLYIATYVHTQRHPSVTEEATVMRVVESAVAKALAVTPQQPEKDAK